MVIKIIIEKQNWTKRSFQSLISPQAEKWYTMSNRHHYQIWHSPIK